MRCYQNIELKFAVLWIKSSQQQKKKSKFTQTVWLSSIFEESTGHVYLYKVIHGLYSLFYFTFMIISPLVFHKVKLFGFDKKIEQMTISIFG